MQTHLPRKYTCGTLKFHDPQLFFSDFRCDFPVAFLRSQPLRHDLFISEKLNNIPNSTQPLQALSTVPIIRAIPPVLGATRTGK